jgi:hypothetical protein
VNKRQHYVFRSYLESWAVDGRLYCLRNGIIFPSDPAKVAVEKYFYEPQILEPADILLLDKAIIEPSPEASKEAHRDLLNCFVAISEMKRRLNALDPNHPLYSELEEGIVDFEENYHGHIEGRLKTALCSMLSGDTSFYFETDQLIDFLTALCVQYMRTKKIREALVSRVTPPGKGASIRRMANVLCHIAALNAAGTLFVERDRFRLILLHNDTLIPLITGDQPVVNLHGSESKVLSHDQFELYYPLSPMRAMALVHVGNHLDRSLTAKDVNRCNALIVRESHEQVFSNSEESLEQIRNTLFASA